MGKCLLLLYLCISWSLLWGAPSPNPEQATNLQTSSTTDSGVSPATAIAMDSSSLVDTTGSPWLLQFSGTTAIPPANDGRETITFSIYAEQSLGAALWSEEQSVQIGKGGRYRVLLGTTTPGGLPSDVLASSEPRWLGVRIGDGEEGPRTLLAAVPYAIKALEADKLAGHPASDFVTSDVLQSVVQRAVEQQSSAASQANQAGARSFAAADATSSTSDQETQLSGNTTDQILWVQQNGSGVALNASAANNTAIVGTSSAAPIQGIVAGVEGVTSVPTGYGIYGMQTAQTGVGPTAIYGLSESPNGIGISASSTGTGGTIGLTASATSTGGIAVDASETATSGNPIGLVASVQSPAGTSALLLNTGGGPLLTAQTNHGTQFSVDGTGNVLAAGTIITPSTISGGLLVSNAAPGTPPLQVSSTTQVPNLNAGLLGGLPSAAFLKNGASLQTNASFNIDGNGTVGGVLAANSVNTNQFVAGTSLTVGSNPSQNGQVVIMPDNLDTVHSWIGQAGSEMHFRLSRALSDPSPAPKNFLITPYDYGTAIEYPGVIEVWSSALSVHMNHALGGNAPAYFWVGDELDLGGLFATANYPSSAGPNGNITIAADKFDHTSHGKMYFTVRNPDDAFVFNWGSCTLQESPYAAIRRVTVSPLIQTNIEAYSGAVTGAMISDSHNNVVRFGSRTVHPVQLFTGDGAGALTVYPSGNVAIGQGGDIAKLAVGDSSQFQVSSAGAVTIGGGTPIVSHLSSTVAVTYENFRPNSCQTVSLSLPGASDGDTVALGISGVLASVDRLTWFGFVDAQDSVSIRACNITTAPIRDVPSGTARVDVWKH